MIPGKCLSIFGWGKQTITTENNTSSLLTLRPANETCTYGLTKSFTSPVNARFTLAINEEFMRGNPSAR